MTIVVPFDNSDLSKAALRRARTLTRDSEAVRAVAVVPRNNDQYARERGWIDDESFDIEQAVRRLSEVVSDVIPGAGFDYVSTGRYANPGQIANEIRNYAREHDARVVVIGSENAGRIVSAVTSVGTPVASSSAYDVYIVRHERAAIE